MKNIFNLRKNIVLLFMLVFLTKGILYATYLMPVTLNVSPDDVGHLSYVQYISSEHKLPVLGETMLEKKSLESFFNYLDTRKGVKEDIFEETFDTENVNWIAQHPPVYYLYLLPFYNISKMITHDLGCIIIVLRIATLFLGLLTMFFLNKIINILNYNKIAKCCILATFTFMSSIQFSFSGIGNDSMLILLSVISLYLLMMYQRTDKSKYLYTFSLACGGIIITKYTGGLLLPVYAAYFIYISLKNRNYKKFFKESIVCVLIFSAVVLPILIRNYIVYDGNIFETYEMDKTIIQASFLDFIQRGYFNTIFEHIINFTGSYKLTVAPDFINASFSLLACFISIISINNIKNKNFKVCKILVIVLFIIFVFIFHYIFNTSFITCIAMFSWLNIIISNIILEDIHKIEKLYSFFAATIIFVFVVFMFQHYEAFLSYGGHYRATHGRYYFILIPQALLFLFNFANKYNTKYDRYLLCTYITILMFFESWLFKLYLRTW